MGAARPTAAPAAAPDLALIGGEVFTADSARPWAEALAIRGDRILAVETNDQVRRLARRSTRVVALGGRVVIPGINDAHDHLGDVPLGVDVRTSASPTPDPTTAQVLDSVRAVAARTPAEAWIKVTIGPGVLADPAARRATLDRVGAGHSVLLWTWWGHGAVLNTAGLRALGIAETAADPLGGWYERDRRPGTVLHTAPKYSIGDSAGCALTAPRGRDSVSGPAARPAGPPSWPVEGRPSPLRAMTCCVRVSRALVRVLVTAGPLLVGGTRAAGQSPGPASGTGPIVAGPIVVGPDTAVTVGADTLPVVEPHLAVDPRDPAHLVAGTVIVERPDLVNGDPRPGVSRFRCAALASFDGGRRWTAHVFPVPDCLDPWVAVHPNGTAFFALIALDRSRLLVYRSVDGGRTWGTRPADFGASHDHATMIVDTTGGPRHGRVYVVSRQEVRRADGVTRSHAYVAHTADAGRTWDTTRVVPFSLAMNTMSAAVRPDGSLIVPLGTFGPPLGDADWFITSADGGRTFSEPVAAPRGCAKSFPHLAADGSRGPYRGRLYYVCNDSAYTRILVFRSGDGAERWAPPVAANAGSGPAPYVRTAVAAVNADGVLGVSWYDARHDASAAKGRVRCQELFFAASRDGGRTFIPEVRVSTGRNCPATPRNGQAATRWPAGGDYHGLVAAPAGGFRLLWADSRSGAYQLRFATVRVGRTASAPPAAGPPR